MLSVHNWPRLYSVPVLCSDCKPIQCSVFCWIGNCSNTCSLMIYTSIILLTVLEIFSLNEWENISLFLTNFLCLEEFAGVIVLLAVTLPSSHYLLIILITYWSTEFPPTLWSLTCPHLLTG